MPLARSLGVFVFLSGTGVAGTALVGAAVYGDDGGIRCLDGFDTAFETAFYHDFSLLGANDFFGIRDLRNAEFLSHLRTYLRRIAVDCLTTADYEVEVADFAHGASQCIRGSQRVGSGKSTVGEQIAAVGAAKETFANDVGCAGRTHREQFHRRSGIFFFELKRLFERVQVFGIKDGGKGGAIDGAVGFHGIFPYVSGIRHLLGKYHNFQTHK